MDIEEQFDPADNSYRTYLHLRKARDWVNEIYANRHLNEYYQLFEELKRFEVSSKHGAFYTGGNVEWIDSTLFCQTASSISLVNYEDGKVSKTIGEEFSEDADLIQTFTTDGEKVISSHKSGLLKLWNLEGQLVKMWKYIHNGPIATLTLSNSHLASGGSDGVVRLWDMQHQTCILSLRDCQGVVNVVEFDEGLLFASGDDGKVHTWEMPKGIPSLVYSGHFSKVTSIVIARDGNHFVTAGRDKVVILWQKNQTKLLRAIPMYQAVEVITRLPSKFRIGDFKADPEGVYVASGGEDGLVRIWDVLNAKEIYRQNESLVSKADDGGMAIAKLICNNKNIAVVSAEHNIVIHHLKSFTCLKQFVGFADEIFSIVFVGPNESHLAVATNSRDIKLYDNETMSCQLLKGHSDMVVGLSTCKSNPNLMASVSKDNRVRLWLMCDSNTMSCVGIGIGHTASVLTATFPETSSSFLFSGSEDKCLKRWEIPNKLNKLTECAILNCTVTEAAHQKDINHIAVAPNDKLVVTASQDKTAKLYTADTLTLLGVLRGHKRGVWCCAFSPVDQVVITSSADCTIKLWSVAELSCLKTLDGHESSILNVAFLSRGLQILSTGSDGLIKLFNVKTSDCVATFEQQETRIWALAIKRDESLLVTGGTDSCLTKWKDVTEERKLQRLQEEEELARQQQKLSNYLNSGQTLKALKLALRLNRPFQVLKIVQAIIKDNDAEGLEATIRALKNEQKSNLLKCANTWNTDSRNCQSAQMVLNILLKELHSGEFRPEGLRSVIEEALPYSERHFNRLTRTMQDLHLINYTINCIKPV